MNQAIVGEVCVQLEAACAVVGECNLRCPPRLLCLCCWSLCFSGWGSLPVSLSTELRAMCSEFLFRWVVMFKLCLEIRSLLQGHRCWCLKSVPAAREWAECGF